MDDLMDRARRQLDRMRDASASLADISATATCPGGFVTAVVDGDGALTRLAFSDSARRIDAQVLGDAIVTTAAKAAASAFARRAAVLSQFNDDMTGLTRPG